MHLGHARRDRIRLKPEPADRPYGMRDFEVVDPSGNRIAFEEPTAG